MSMLMMLALGLGMSFSLVLLTMGKTTSYNPMEHKIDRLYSVQTDNWSEEPGSVFFQSRNFMPTAVSFRDAKAILASGIPAHTTMLSASGAILDNPEKPETPPQMHSGYLVTRDFFKMFDVPFKYGGSWEEQGVYTGIHKIVLNEWANKVFFDGENAVGKLLLVNGTPYTVVGILEASWYQAPRMYDPSNSPLGYTPGLFFPFEDVSLYDFPRWGGHYDWQKSEVNTHDGFLNSEILWARPWVEFEGDQQKESFKRWLQGYIELEQSNGRYRRSNKFELSNTREWMIVVSGFQGFGELALAGLILLICSTNSIALLMAKFLRTTNDSAVRRALGASRLSIFAQHIFEALLIAVGGGLLALLIGFYWFEVIKRTMTGADYEYLSQFAHLNVFSLLIIFCLVLVSTLLSGAIPAWRISRSPPVRYLNAE